MASSNRKSKNKSGEIEINGVFDIQNMDLERADEFIVSAEKKKLEDTYREDDQEDLLFDEQECLNTVWGKPIQIADSSKETESSKEIRKNSISIVRKHERKTIEKRSKFKSKAREVTLLEFGNKKHSCKLEQRFHKHLKEQLHKTSKTHHNYLENNHNEDGNKNAPNERTITNPDFLKNLLEKYEPQQQNIRNKVSPITSKRRVSIDSGSETEDPEPIIHRRSIRVNRIGLNLRQKMLHRLQAAQSRYLRTKR